MLGIYKFHWDCGRNGSLRGTFVADSSKIESSISKFVYFGEVLGKHSQIQGVLTEEDFTLVSDKPEHVDWFISLDLANGFNPFDYLEAE